MANRDLTELFLKGECTAQELEQIKTWLSRPENKDEAEALFKKMWKESSGEYPLAQYDKEALLSGILNRVNAPQKAKSTKKRVADRAPYRRARKRRVPAGLKVALGLVLALTVGYLIMPKDTVTRIQAEERVLREAPRGYRNTVKLADGSVVTLNSESTLEYSADFGLEDRIIYLSGEAFFEVAHNPQKPFVVIANGLKTTALGTSFNINAYQSNNTAVSLATGKVKVEISHPETKKQQQLILIPGEQAVWAGVSKDFIKREFDFQEILSWKNNVIYFNNTELQSMIRVLEKWYDVQITIVGENQKLTHTGTGKFKNESLENVLSSLGYSMGFTYQINDKKITLTLNED